MGCSASQQRQYEAFKQTPSLTRKQFEQQVAAALAEKAARIETNSIHKVETSRISEQVTQEVAKVESRTEARLTSGGEERSSDMEAEKCSTRDNLDNSSVVEDENCAAVEDNVRVAKNTFTADQSLPELTRNFGPVDFPYTRGMNNSKWPIRCYVRLQPSPFNVNAGHGGAASLVQISNSYGGKGEETTSEVFLLRSGYDSNHMSWVSLSHSHAGHFGPASTFVTDEHGNLVPDCLFGSNHVTILSNDARYGNLSHGILVEGSAEKSTTVLPVNVNGSQTGNHGAGSTLVLCSGWESRVDDAQFVSAVYMVRSGFKDNKLQSSLIKGDDKWAFVAGDDGMLMIAGVGRSRYAVYHNRDNLVENVGVRSRSFSTQVLTGTEAKELVEMSADKHFVMLVLCSHSSGIEDATAASLYLVSCSNGNIKSVFINGRKGSDYKPNIMDLWSFEVTNQRLWIRGPDGPCRIAFVSNLHGNDFGCFDQHGCLATGEDEPIRGAVAIDNGEAKGWVSRQSAVLVTVNEHKEFWFQGSELKTVVGRKKWAFQHKWEKREKKPGISLVRIFAVRKNFLGSNVYVEIDGSPQQLTFQPEGVLYALNSGGPAYTALNDVVYTSEFSQYASYTYDHMFGSRCLALGGSKTHGRVPQIVTATNDGFLYVSSRSSGVEAQDEGRVQYEVKDLPNSKAILRLHFVHPSIGRVTVNGQLISESIKEQLKKQKNIPDSNTAHQVDIPFVITDHKVALHLTNQMISGFALLDAGRYNEKVKSAQEQTEEAESKQRLADQVEPLSRTLAKKEHEIVGWSQNLLQNASGENCDMSHWNVSGSWKTQDGGHGTEKAFVTSHMRCVKWQEVDLTEVFSEDYLDTAPPIQASEWYKEGCGGGGFYSFQVTLHTAEPEGRVLKTYDSGEFGSLYKNQQWQQELVEFTDYGQGLRRISLQSYGKDDKYWAGTYGTVISDATIRVKRETQVAEDDAFIDVQTSDDKSTVSSGRDKLVAKVLSDNEELLKELMEEKVLVDIDPILQKQLQFSMVKPSSERRKRKKREIRVFVSSTFRDFKAEREELIKKTFREVNGLCADRGVFFTYVDLRWGITEEQTNHGQTIAICLQEISRCQPYFVCLMGERFGWSQVTEKPDKLLNSSFDYAIENFPQKLGWVEQYRYGASVTQLEVLHGVLNDMTDRKDRSFFYLRDPVSRDSCPEDVYKMLGPESEWHQEKQTALRRRVQETAGLKVKTYNQVDEVCDFIKKDLEWCIEQDFPRGTELTPLEREKEAHIAFADVRRRVYIGRGEYFTQIDNFMMTHQKEPLVILGESGSGKSALVANWVGKVEESEPGTFLFIHFIGSSAESASYLKLLRRLYEEMKKHFGFGLAIPSSDTNVVQDLTAWLTMAGSQSKCLLVLDALNQLDDGSGTEGAEHDLLWLPRELPPGVHMLLSTLPGRTLQAIQTAGWPTIQVSPLDPSEKLQIVTGYLEGIYGKTLSEDQKALIVDAPQTNNPLYLRALLDEVRVYGNFRNLTEKIREYLMADSPGDLFAKILERLEGDFEHGQQPRPGLVRDTTTAIWCSHRGMSESELLMLLDIPGAVWSPFYLSLIENLVNRNGIVNFFHDHLRQAVENKYLATSSDKQRTYCQLADFFTARKLDDRVVDELPFLLAKAGELERLRATISDLEVFERMVGSEDGKFELINSWKLIPGAVWSPFYLSLIENLVNRNGIVNFFHDHLRQAVENKYLATSSDKQRTYCQLADFFTARKLDDRVVDELPFLLAKAGELERLRATISDLEVFERMVGSEDGKFELINSWKLLGDFSQVQMAYTQALEKCSQPNPTLQQSLAEFFIELGLLDAARLMLEQLLHTLEEKYRTTHSAVVYDPFSQTRMFKCQHTTVLDMLHNLGTVCEKQKNFEQALHFYTEAVSRQTRVVTPAQKLQLTEGLLGEATVLYLMDNMTEAKKFLVRAQELATEVLGPRHHYVAAIVNKLGQLSYKQGRIDEALGYFLQDLNLTRSEVGTSHPRTASVLNDIALVYDDKNDRLAGQLYEAALMILLDVFGQSHLDVATVRYNLGAFYFATNSFARAKFQFQEAARIHETFLGAIHPDTVDSQKSLREMSAFVQ